MYLWNRKKAMADSRLERKPYESSFCSSSNTLEAVSQKNLETTEFSYFDIPAKIPVEILASILKWLDTETLTSISAAGKELFKVQSKDLKNTRLRSSKQTIDYLWRAFETIVENSRPLFFEQATDCQFPLVSKVFSREQVTWTHCPNSMLWEKMDAEEAFEFFEYWDDRTETAVQAIQQGLPGMRQTNIIRYYLLHLWFWYGTSSRCPYVCRTQESWNYFASLSRHKQLGIVNFFDNLGCCFLEKHPPKYSFDSVPIEPTVHSCQPLCAQCMELLKQEATSNVHQWSIPRYIPTELEKLGVTDIIGTQLVMSKFVQFYDLLNTREQRPLTPTELERILNFFTATKDNGNFWNWPPRAGPPLFKTAGRFVMRLDETTYEIWVTGQRGNGTIELRLPLSRSKMYNWSRLFEDALSCNRETNVPLQIKPWVLRNSHAPSYVIDRTRYWCWTEWSFRENEDLGLDNILFGNAAW